MMWGGTLMLFDSKKNMKEIKDHLYSTSAGAGGYIVSLDEFSSILEFIRRMIVRNPKNISMVLLSVDSTDDDEANHMASLGMDCMEKTILKSLRREDVAARCSASQFTILLINANQSQGSMVIDRLINKCLTNNPELNVKYSFEIFQMDVDHEIEAELGNPYGERFRDKCCIYDSRWISYCIGNKHVDIKIYEEQGKKLINRMCLGCGYRWTIERDPSDENIKVVWCEGDWWKK